MKACDGDKMPDTDTWAERLKAFINARIDEVYNFFHEYDDEDSGKTDSPKRMDIDIHLSIKAKKR